MMEAISSVLDKEKVPFGLILLPDGMTEKEQKVAIEEARKWIGEKYVFSHSFHTIIS